MKAILSNKIYMTVTPSYYKVLEKELTYSIPSYADPLRPIIIKNISIINHDIEGKYLVAFPIGRVDLIPETYEVVDQRCQEKIDFPDIKEEFELRKSQADVVEDLDDNCIVNAPGSWGKTFAALFAAHKLGQKTLIICHTVNIRNQWEKEVVKLFGIKPGIIGSGKFNIDSPIVISNVQTLVKHTKELARQFGTLILDEMHHVSSPTFKKIIDGMFSRYKIGLSGTIQRKDGKHVVFKDYFGKKLYQPPAENYLKPKVEVAGTGIILPQTGSWADRVTALKESPVFETCITGLADHYADMGHKVLIVSDRVDFIQRCAERNKERATYVTSGVKDVDERHKLIETGEKDQLFASISMYSEGISLDYLSCLILAAQVNNEPLLEQLIWRVVRKYPDKPQPIIVDPKLEGFTANNQFSTRLGIYMKKGYQVDYV